jgi:hypothetical protein
VTAVIGAAWKARQKDNPGMDLRTDTGDYDLSERPLSLKEAVAHLGVSQRYFLIIRKKYARSFEICEWRGRKPVFYRKHISNLRNAMKCETSDNPVRSKEKPAGTRSGMAGRTAMTLPSRGKGTVSRQTSVIKRRLK